jgi:carboxylesterase
MLALNTSAIASAVVYSATFEYDGWNMNRFYRKSPKVLQHVAHLPGIRSISIKEPYPYGLKDERLREYASKPGSRFIAGALDRMPLGALYQMYKLGQHLEKVAPMVKMPTLILHARDDDMSNPRNAHRLCAALGGPARVELLTDSYHMIHLDKERHRVADLTAEFLLAPLGVRARPLEAASA